MKVDNMCFNVFKILLFNYVILSVMYYTTSVYSVVLYYYEDSTTWKKNGVLPNKFSVRCETAV